jgi:hypothetical protein
LAAEFPAVEGSHIRIRFRRALTASGGKLLSNADRGKPVHAASLIRKREIVLDTALRSNRRELARIFVHELFHFAWARLGNQRRSSYGQLVRRELAARARGELGWSAEEMKERLKGTEDGTRWRAYVCESFCDTAAFLYAGCKRHDEFTLSPKWQRRRARWFRESLGGQTLSI